jgi:hypothetical protein
MITGKRILFSLALLFSAAVSFAQKSPASESDLKKQAEKLFEKEVYQEALPMYSQLLSLYPREAVYNYRYGVCLLMSGQDKTGAATYLEAAAKVKETDADVHFYLGRSYMFMDHFNEALAEFSQFKKTGTSAKQSKLGVDRLIQNCNNANVLRMDRKNVVVLEKSKVSRTAFFAAYDFTDAAGKLLTTPDRFLTPIDKAKMPNPVMFMTRDGETIYFASYGKKGENGKDLYKIVKLSDGSWGEPSNLGGTVNTNADEDYPYLDKDGRTLYFSSTGHNSIGGYDVFKTQYDFNSGRWNDPANAGMPINTVDDDLFFMPATKGESAVYCTAVETEAGKIELRKIGLSNVVSNLAVINGQYISEDQVTRRDARITVIRNRDNGVVTSVKTDRTGQYELVLPAGEEYMLVVEGGSYLPHAENFSVPSGKTIPGMQQKVVMNKTTETEVLTMSNYFTASSIDSSIASLEKPSQVKKSEFDMKDTSTSRMQAITFEGRTLYVAPPSIKTPDVKAVVLNELAVKEKSDSPDYREPETETMSKTAAAKNEETDVNTSPENKKDAVAVANPAVNEKTSNAEIVKMSFEDAQSMKEEANSLRQEADEMRVEAHALDSLSKIQLKQANLLLSSGDKEMSQVVFKQSQENILAAEVKNNEAKKLDAEAHERDLDYEISHQEAVQLMKEFKVDTNAASYQSIALKEKEKETQDIPDDEISAGLNNNIHAVRSKQLEAEADSLFSESKYTEEQSTASKDKKQKAFLSEKAKELNEQGESRMAESRLETELAEKENESSVATTSAVEKDVVPSSPENESVKASSSTGKATGSSVGVKTAGSEPSNSSIAKNENSNPAVKNDATPAAEGENTNSVNPSSAVPETVAIQGSKSKDAAIEKPKQKLGPVANVEPAAQQHFENYQEQLYESKRLEASSKETEAKLLTGNSPATRDSLEAKTAELNKESIRQWQNASKELAMAKEIDPAIEEKMADAEKKSTINVEPVVQQLKNAEGSSLNNGQQRGKETGSISQSESQVKPGAALNAPLAESKSEADNNTKPVSTSENISPSGTNSQPIAVTEVLDTTKPAYPEYVATQKEITVKQTETVDIFVAGMQLSKQASAIKKEEFSVRDQAAVSTDKKEKAKLVERADSLAMEADVLAEKSKAMLTVAQKNTNEVKALKVKSDNLKTELIVKNVPEEQAQAESSVTSAGNTKSGQQEIIEQKQVSSSETDSSSTSSSAQKNSIQQQETISENQSADGKSKTEWAAENESGVTQETSGTDLTSATTETSPAASREDKSQTENESKPTISGKSDPGVSSVKTETVPAASTQDKTQAENKTANENQTAPEQGTSTKEMNPLQGEEPTVTIGEKNVEGETSDAVQTKVEKEVKIDGQQSNLVFEKEATDETTFSLAKTNSSSESNVIPMNPPLPEGLVFKVQIGAFRKPLPANSFNNLQPLSGETTRPGWIRYCLGLFRTFEPANLLKKEVRSMGYKDAFVVAYYNGKRIPLYDAYAIISKANAADKQTYSTVTTNEFKQLEKFEIKKSSYDLKPDADTKAFYGTSENIPAELVEYAVQVGVYKTSRTPSALSTLVPLNTEQTSSGLFRFTTGRFDNRASADSMRRIAVNTGIKDAFIVIYKGGKKAGPRETQQIITATRKETPVNNLPAVQPSTVKPASDESISASDVVFKIQLGAFKENVPFSAVSAFLSVADKGITQETDARGLHIFYAGQYTNYDEALAARSDIASKGVKDAFIVAFVKGKRTNATEALKLLNRN